MDLPMRMTPRSVAPDTESFTVYLPIPGFGVLPANAFLIRAAEPVLVDAGPVALGEAFLAQIAERIDLQAIRWIWLTHLDPDHIGSLDAILAAAPEARIVTPFLGMGKVGLSRQLPPQRFYLLNPGQRLDAGDRSLIALRPPTYDAPETLGCFDTRTRTLFSADCFGALTSTPRDRADEIGEAELREGLVTWAGVDVPWLSLLRPEQLDREMDVVRRLDPAMVLGSHLPPAPGRMLGALLEDLEAARGAAPAVGPDQAALEQMLAGG